MIDSKENYKFDLGVKGLNEKCHPYITSNSLHYTQEIIIIVNRGGNFNEILRVEAIDKSNTDKCSNRTYPWSQIENLHKRCGIFC